MKNNIVLGLCMLLILLMSLTPPQPKKVTICKIIDSARGTRDFIIQKTSEGYRVVSVTSFAEGWGAQNYNDFLIVMEK